MKTTSYRLQSEIEQLSPANQKSWFTKYIKEILEDDSPHYQKSDYIAKSFMELDSKIEYLDSEIDALKAIKNKLTQAKEMGLEITAKILQEEYGIDKMEGAFISSLTIAPSKTKTTQTITVKNPNKVMELGYVTFSVDNKALKEAIDNEKDRKELEPYITISSKKETVEAKLKINKRRTANTTVETIELLASKEVA
jgi:hypothetical protein